MKDKATIERIKSRLEGQRKLILNRSENPYIIQKDKDFTELVEAGLQASLAYHEGLINALAWVLGDISNENTTTKD
jgi:hypothetical protein